MVPDPISPHTSANVEVSVDAGNLARNAPRKSAAVNSINGFMALGPRRGKNNDAQKVCRERGKHDKGRI